MVIDPGQLWNIFREGGTLAIVFFLVWGGIKGLYVFKPQHEKMMQLLEEDRNYWRELALRGTSIAQKAVEVAEKKA